MTSDWASRMYGQIRAHKDRPFSWGENDCCRFVARVIDAMTDSQIEAALADIYSDEAGALRFIASHGGLQGAMSAFLGEPSGRATRGDAVMFEGGHGEAAGICIGARIVAVGPQGLHYVPRSEILVSWKLP